ncbi:MAG: YdcF family protein [Thermomicrobiales bacterium]|nr:YdcF family protein [Thermomicrobiales bacterium]
MSELWRWGIAGAITGVLAVALLGVSLFAAIYWQARSDQTGIVDAIVVLGTAQYNGRPSPALRARLDEVLAAYDAGVAPYIVVTGGKQPADVFTEAEASRDYLIEHGVPESAILMESEGRDSWQSMRGAAEALRRIDAERILIVSDGFHLFRLKLMARELGFSPIARGASDSPIRPNSGSEFDYIVRETAATVAFLVRH